MRTERIAAKDLPRWVAFGWKPLVTNATEEGTFVVVGREEPAPIEIDLDDVEVVGGGAE